MRKVTRWVGLDVHAETIAIAVAETDGTVRSLGTIPNTPEAVARLVRKLGDRDKLRVCYEAGPCGYVLYWQLTKLGVGCDVVAPTLIPVKAGDRVKTDRRDAEKLARCHRSGDLTSVWVPDAQHEALRDLVRAREAARKDQLRARHRLGKFLLRRGLRRPEGSKAWGSRHAQWLAAIHFEQQADQDTFIDYRTEVEHAVDRIERLERAIDAAIECAPAQTRALADALQSLRGVAKVTAITVVAELGRLSRFEHPRQRMGYSGMVSSEDSTGKRTRRGGITKTGNSHLRRVLVEAAWMYRFSPQLYPSLRKRQEGQSEAIKAIAWKAQHRLHHRYRRLTARGKPQPQVVTAVARELLGFIWSIGVQVEHQRAAKCAA
jgi:transposase